MVVRHPEGISDYHDPGGGWGAVKALAVSLREQQLVMSGVATLLKQNQTDGFECRGCAWPDPKHTSAFEFCENGANAITWESTATATRVGSDLFATHTVSSLWKKSDHWLEDQDRLTHPLRYNVQTDRIEAVEWRGAFDDNYNLPDGCCDSYCPQSQPLALEFCDPECLTPSYNSTPVKITKASISATGEGAVARDGVMGCQVNSATSAE